MLRPVLRLVLCLLAILAAAPAQAQTAHSLDQVPGLIHTPEGKAAWQQQMEGKPAPDGLGTQLPPGLSADQITRLLVPAADHAPVVLVGARPWPRRPDSYVAIACIGGDGTLSASERKCEMSGNRDDPATLTAYLGVIELKPGGEPRLVAASGPVDGTAVNWSNTSLPASPINADDGAGHSLGPESWDRFDLAAYRIRPDEYAFGLRGSWNELYSGGGAFYQALYLFRIDGHRLRLIWAAPMSAFQSIAGNWNDDGTRQHDITDGDNVLVVSSQQTNGYFDLTLKGDTRGDQQTFRWSAADGAYRSGPR